MSLIQLKSLGIASPRLLFQNLDLTLHAGDRLGLIAGNGAGKTTLLRCLAGQLEPGAGEIVRRRGLRLGFVEQDVPDTLLNLPLAETVRRALALAEREANGWKVDLALDAFETPAEMRDRPLAELSGGWQRLALIARAGIAEPDLLLLDEPTNHLDGDRLEMLENWLRHGTEGTAMVIASHDRAFLDACTTRTLFLRPELSRLYPLPFSRARAALAEDEAAEAAKLARDAKEVERLRRSAAHHRNVGINSGSDLWLKKSKQLGARADAIEESLKPQHRERAGELRLDARDSHAKVLARLDDITVTAPDGRALFRTGALRLHQGERVVVGGANGIGKSQLIRLLHRAAQGEAVPGVTVSPSAVTGYVDQQMAQLPAEETPLGFIAGTFRPGDQRALSLLAGAGFDIETQRRRIAQLSPGQKARLGLLALRLVAPNFYLLDEPTNHVDIAGRERLEAEILEHRATCLLVSHDRWFVRAVGTRFLRVERGRLVEA
ncbi:ATP-binding cassette domain-containing protein [Desertibaculum subflavum]|uniref:ATP-binding cassette domain-containing protein n=1 Tax=Desertibaculum subflavum TaxID=2268458 RepID=UPI000E66F837